MNGRWHAYERRLPTAYFASTADVLATPTTKNTWRVGDRWYWRVENRGDAELAWLKARSFDIQLEPIGEAA